MALYHINFNFKTVHLLKWSRIWRWLQILVTLVLASKALHNARSMAVGFLAIATVMLMISADKFLNLMDIAYGNDILYADRVSVLIDLDCDCSFTWPTYRWDYRYAPFTRKKTQCLFNDLNLEKGKSPHLIQRNCYLHAAFNTKTISCQSSICGILQSQRAVLIYGSDFIPFNEAWNILDNPEFKRDAVMSCRPRLLVTSYAPSSISVWYVIFDIVCNLS